MQLHESAECGIFPSFEDLLTTLSGTTTNGGMACCNRHDWEQARAAGLRAVALLERETGAPQPASVGIAATRPPGLAAGPPRLAGLRAERAGRGARRRRGDPAARHGLGSAAVRLSPEGEAEVVWGRGPIRRGSRAGPSRCRPPGRRWGEVVLHDGVPRWRAHRRSRGTPIPSSTRSSCGRPLPCRPGWSCWRRPTEADRTPWNSLAAEAGFAAEDWSSSVRWLCRSCSECRHAQDEGDWDSIRPRRPQ